MDMGTGRIGNIDNDTRRVDYAQLGAVAGVDTGTRGAYYLDAFESRRQTYIGLASEASRTLGAALNLRQHPGSTRVKAQALDTASFVRVEGVTFSTGAAITVTQVVQATLPAAAHVRAVLAPSTEAQPLPGVSGAPALTSVSQTITYTYDPLYSLKRTDYSDGTYFSYTYDAAGNRLTEQTTGGTSSAYVYDAANRMLSAGGIVYTWDDNGNLLSDGGRTYTYNHANRLVGVNSPTLVSSMAYNGQGDRLQQTVNGVTTTYMWPGYGKDSVGDMVILTRAQEDYHCGTSHEKYPCGNTTTP